MVFLRVRVALFHFPHPNRHVPPVLFFQTSKTFKLCLQFSFCEIRVVIHDCHDCRHRLELMRHIYNEDLSPQTPDQARQDLFDCISVCASHRFSLANLMPSRFVGSLFLGHFHALSCRSLLPLPRNPCAYCDAFLARAPRFSLI